jgi:hypothetical protein
MVRAPKMQKPRDETGLANPPGVERGESFYDSLDARTASDTNQKKTDKV